MKYFFFKKKTYVERWSKPSSDINGTENVVVFINTPVTVIFCFPAFDRYNHITHV